MSGNIATLNSVAGQQQRVQEMAEQLAGNEARIKGLRQRIRNAQVQAEEMEAQVEADLAALSF